MPRSETILTVHFNFISIKKDIALLNSLVVFYDTRHKLSIFLLQSQGSLSVGIGDTQAMYGGVFNKQLQTTKVL